MRDGLLMTFIFNLFVLFGGGYVFGKLAPYLPNSRIWLWRFVVGGLAACLTIISHYNAYYSSMLLNEEVFFEVGVVAIAVASMFGSLFSGLVSVSLVSLYFYYLGGWNMLPGMISLAAAALVGGIFYLLLAKRKELLKPSFKMVFYCGLVLAATTLGSFFLWGDRFEAERILTSGFFVVWLLFIPLGVIIFTRVVFDMLNLRHLLQKTSMQAYTDYLTGLFNRRHLYSRLEKEIERARRYGHPFSLLIVDVDYFKSYNDCHGHLAGDAALVQIANIIRKSVRTIDQAARWGGEEFSVILPETDIEGAIVVAERIRNSVESIGLECSGSQGRLKNTVSVGVATYLRTASSMDMLLSQADEALYQAKNGRNRVVVYQHGKRDWDGESREETEQAAGEVAENDEAGKTVENCYSNEEERGQTGNENNLEQNSVLFPENAPRTKI